jgi:hypothetical protein
MFSCLLVFLLFHAAHAHMAREGANQRYNLFTCIYSCLLAHPASGHLGLLTSACSPCLCSYCLLILSAHLCPCLPPCRLCSDSSYPCSSTFRLLSAHSRSSKNKDYGRALLGVAFDGRDTRIDIGCTACGPLVPTQTEYLHARSGDSSHTS